MNTLKVLFLAHQPPDKGFEYAVLRNLLGRSGVDFTLRWRVVEWEDTSKVEPHLRPWLLSKRQLVESPPDLIVVELDDCPDQHLALADLTMPLVYLGARAPLNYSEEALLGFRQIGFPWAVNERNECPYLATAPNNSEIDLHDVRFPAGFWIGDDEIVYQSLFVPAYSYILCPEEGGFQTLLTAPESYQAKTPTWSSGSRFGKARKPYCFAGIRWIPRQSICFASDMFRDGAIERGDNLKMFRDIVYEIMRHKVTTASRRGDKEVCLYHLAHFVDVSNQFIRDRAPLYPDAANKATPVRL